MRLPPVNACYPPVIFEQICKFWARFHRFWLRFQYPPVFVPCYCPISGCDITSGRLNPTSPGDWHLGQRVAVGTIIADRSPHRSVRALLRKQYSVFSNEKAVFSFQ